MILAQAAPSSEWPEIIKAIGYALGIVITAVAAGGLLWFKFIWPYLRANDKPERPERTTLPREVHVTMILEQLPPAAELRLQNLERDRNEFRQEIHSRLDQLWSAMNEVKESAKNTEVSIAKITATLEAEARS